MNFYISSDILHNGRGNGLFCARLADAMSRAGIHVDDNPTRKYDIALHVVRKTDVVSRRHVLRLDGVYYDTSCDYKQRNAPIMHSLRAVDAIIYQSKFSKSLCDRYLGKFKGPSTIIFNGADPAVYASAANLDRSAEHIFLAASRWRPVKRLKETIYAFNEAAIPNSILYVAGDIKKSALEHNKWLNVKFLGVLDQVSLARYVKLCDIFMHIGFVDNCPNSVVEAICARKPVISTNIGGTCEIVSKSNGIVCELDNDFALSPIDLSVPPAININKLASTMSTAVLSSYNIENIHVNINDVARQYISFCESLL